MAIRGIKRVLRLRFTRKQIEQEVDEEMAYHVARRAEQLRLAGMSAGDAMAEASKRFGDVHSARQQCIEESVAEMRADTVTAFLDHARSDLRFALRSLRRAPAFTAVALMTLVIGIASVTTIVSFVYSYTLKPLPYPNANRIVAITEHRPNDRRPTTALPIADGRTIASTARVFDRIAVYQTGGWQAAVRGHAAELTTLFVDSSFAPMFGLRAQIGRVITPDEIASNAPVLTISDVLWRTSFGSDTSIVGHPMRFGDELLTVVGVMPPGFRFPDRTNVWRPLHLGDSSEASVRALGKLARGVSRRDAANDLALIAQRMIREDPTANSGMTLSVVDMIDRGLDGVASLSGVFIGAAILVLLIACSNVANLMLVRSAERRGEMAVRSALGGGRARLITQSLAEPAVLAVCAGIGGTLLSLASIRILLRVVPTANLPSWLTFGIDGSMLLIVLGIVTIVVFGVGLTPAREGTRFDVVRALKVGGDNGVANSGVAKSARRGIVVQLALSLVLFTGASLLVQTYRHLSAWDVGYPADEIVDLNPFFDRQRYASDTAAFEFAKSVLEQAPTLVGARQVSLRGSVNLALLSGLDRAPDAHPTRQTIVRLSDFRVVIDGDSASTRDASSANVRQFAVSDAYFETLGIHVLQGRNLSPADVAGADPVVVVSRCFAETYWPHQSPLGRRMRFGPRGIRLTVIGVVEDVRDIQSGSRGIHGDPRPDTYMSTRQFVPQNPSVLIRGRGDVSGIQSGAQAIARRIDPNVLTTSFTLARNLETQLSVTRLFGALVGTFAISGLALSIIGIYGIVGYGIAQRTREIGIRIALGGTSHDVLSLVLHESLRFVGIGLGAGLVASLLMSRGLGALLFGVSPTDPVTYVVVCLIFGVIAAIACYLPARRVTRVDPMVALRSD